MKDNEKEPIECKRKKGVHNPAWDELMKALYPKENKIQKEDGE